MSKEEKIKFLKSHGWFQIWTDDYWSDRPCEDNMAGLPLNIAYNMALQKCAEQNRKAKIKKKSEITANLFFKFNGRCYLTNQENINNPLFDLNKYRKNAMPRIVRNTGELLIYLPKYKSAVFKLFGNNYQPFINEYKLLLKRIDA
jgi:hypothetical protein